METNQKMIIIQGNGGNCHFRQFLHNERAKKNKVTKNHTEGVKKYLNSVETILEQ